MSMLDAMGDASSLKREHRKVELANAFTSGKVLTLKSAATYLGLSCATVRKYAKELDLGLIDTDQGGRLLGNRVSPLMK